MVPSIEADSVLRDFLGKIASVRPRIKRIVLFGSRARGTERPDSDYDLLLVVMHTDDALVDVLYEAVMDVLLAHGRLVSLKIFQEKDSPDCRPCSRLSYGMSSGRHPGWIRRSKN